MEVICSKSSILIYDENLRQFSTLDVRDDNSLKTTTYTTPTRLMEEVEREIMFRDFKMPYALIETSTKFVLYEMITGEAKMEEKLCLPPLDVKSVEIISNYIIYCKVE